MSSPLGLTPPAFSEGWPTPPPGCAHGDHTPEAEYAGEDIAEDRFLSAQSDYSDDSESEYEDESDDGNDGGKPATRRYDLQKRDKPAVVNWTTFFKSPEGHNLPFIKEMNRDPNRSYLMKFPDKLFDALGQAHLDKRNERALQSASAMEETGYLTGYYALRAYVVVVQDTRKTPECYTLNTTVNKELATERALEAFRGQFENPSPGVFGGICESICDDARSSWRNCDTPGRRYRDLIWWLDEKDLLTLSVVEGRNLLSMRVVETKIELPQA